MCVDPINDSQQVRSEPDCADFGIVDDHDKDQKLGEANGSIDQNP